MQTANTQTSQTTQSNPQTPGNYTTVQVTPSQSTGGTIKISRPWPIWLTRLLVQVNNQLLILGIVSLLVVGFYWLVQLW